jgi:glycosyltransferase involved in cell wall biosynthesis
MNVDKIIISKKLVSIVITTKNEEFHIGNCLKSIFNQFLINVDIEVIVVDNFSTDQTEIISRKFNVKFFQLGPKRNRQRNYGLLEVAKGDYLLWIDADHILHPHLIENCVNYLNNNEEVVALMVPEVILGDTFFSKSRRFERKFYEGTVIDGSRFIRKTAFVKVGGFSKEWLHGPDDWDLDLKLLKYGKIEFLNVYSKCGDEFYYEMIEKYNINPRILPVAKFHNESNLNLLNHLKKKIHYASNFNGYISSWGKDHPTLKKQMGLSYRYFKVFVENGKWKKILKKPILFCNVILYKIITGFVYIVCKK